MPTSLLSELSEHIAQDGCQSVCFAWTCELIDTELLKDQLALIERVVQQAGLSDHQITLIFNNTVNLDQIHTPYVKHQLNFWRAVAYWHKYFNPEQEFAKQWHAGNQALFLIGKPDSCHRAGWLCSMIHSDLLDQLIYSFNPGLNTPIQERTQQMFDSLGWNVDAAAFGETYQRWLDITVETITPGCGVSLHYTGFPFRHELYQDTSLSLVSETETSKNLISPPGAQYAWSTEKIWRAIANHHPFVAICQPELIEYLTDAGYNVWDHLLVHDQLTANRQTDWNVRLKLANENVKYFLNGPQCGVQVVAEKNAMLMDQHVQQDIDRIFHADTEVFSQFISDVKYGNLVEKYDPDK